MSKILSAKVGGKSVTNREWQSSKVEHRNLQKSERYDRCKLILRSSGVKAFFKVDKYLFKPLIGLFFLTQLFLERP